MSTINERLLQYMWKHQHMRFQYGVHDCALFTCGWVDSECKTSYQQKLKDLSKGRGLRELLTRVEKPGGYASLVHEFCGIHGTDGPGKLGDIGILIQSDGSETLGVQSVRLVHIPGKDGMVSLDSGRIILHWSLEWLQR